MAVQDIQGINPGMMGMMQQGGQPQMAPPMPQPQQQPPQQVISQEDMAAQETLRVEAVVNSVNLAEDMDDEELNKIADDLCKRVAEDKQSMNPWMQKYDEYLKLALQITSPKNFPWKNAANIKYPTLTMAALQFQARAYPALVNGKSIVKGKVIGYDPAGTKAERAERVGKYQTYQLTEVVNNWDEDMDKLCLILPISGCAFKESTWDAFDDKLSVELILPTDIIVNYWAKSMEDARRITRRLYFYDNTIKEYQEEGLFRKVDLPPPTITSKSKEEDENQKRDPVGLTDAQDVPYELWRIYTWLDLDKDKYREPYIVTLEPNSRIILRIQPNYNLKDIRKSPDGKRVTKIKAKRSLVKYDFIPAPDGGLLGVGFGLLLSSMNETVNTTINQLLDQGTMHTTGGGFIGKGIRLAAGSIQFEPNEWKILPTIGDDIKKNVFPLPIREPSPVLLQLLTLMDQAANRVIAISEISTGKLPGQNTPATTTITSVEEGLKVFTAIYKRIHRQLKKEFKIQFELNKLNIEDTEYFQVLDGNGKMMGGEVSVADFNSDDIDVVPESDPNVASDVLRLTKAQQVVELIPLGAVDPAKAGQRILEALDIPNPQELMPQPQPDPAVMKAQMEMQLKQQEAQFKQQEGEMKLQIKAMELKMKEMEMMLNLRFEMMDHQLSMQTSQEKHGMQMQQQREKQELQRQAPQQKGGGKQQSAPAK